MQVSVPLLLHGYCGYSSDYPDICSDRTAMPELYCSCSAGYFNIKALTGTWSPATINTATAGTTTYTFTPDMPVSVLLLLL